MECKFEIDKLIEDYGIDTVVNAFNINTCSIRYYRRGGMPYPQRLLTLDTVHNVNCEDYLVFENVNTLGDRIKKYRLLGFFTTRELADELNMTVGTIQSWEANRTSPTKRYIEELCQLFSVTKAQLLGDVEVIEQQIEELNQKVYLLAKRWSESVHTSDSRLLEQAHSILDQMRVLGVARDLAIKKGSESTGEEFVY